jgi:hypothetical protein
VAALACQTRASIGAAPCGAGDTGAHDMAKESAADSNLDPFKQALPEAGRIRASGARAPRGVNAHAVANAQFIDRRKTEIRYKNGRTLPTSARKLLADARSRELKHSAVLSNNMMDSGQTRPDDVAAHHIVAWQHRDAFPSQRLLFGWGIGINDADNGVYLPRFRKSAVPSLPQAHKHSSLHTWVYYTQVFGRLVLIEPERKNSPAGRGALREIKSELVAGVFPYLEEHVA